MIKTIEVVASISKECVDWNRFKLGEYLDSEEFIEEMQKDSVGHLFHAVRESYAIESENSEYYNVRLVYKGRYAE